MGAGLWPADFIFRFSYRARTIGSFNAALVAFCRVYCEYHYPEYRDLDAAEEQVVHFLNRATQPAWKWKSVRPRPLDQNVYLGECECECHSSPFSALFPRLSTLLVDSQRPILVAIASCIENDPVNVAKLCLSRADPDWTWHGMACARVRRNCDEISRSRAIEATLREAVRKGEYRKRSSLPTDATAHRG